jgi:lysozyme family protein
VFDAAVNNGTGRAVRWLQQVAQVPQDGVIGQRTLDAIGQAAARPGGVTDVCAEFLAQRLLFMTSLSTWKTFGLGWARRLCRLPYEMLDEYQRDR